MYTFTPYVHVFFPVRAVTHFILRATLLALAAGASISPASLPAQQMAPAPAPAVPRTLTPEIRAAVVDSIAAQVTRFYAVADTGRLIGDHLRRQRRAGAYDRITSPELFAEALATDLKKVNGDKHLFVVIRQPGAPAIPMGLDRLPPMQGPTGPTPAPMIAAARRNNFNLGRVEVLPGNVGYIEFRGFSPVKEAEEAVANALRVLEHTDATIIDVRDHGGGSGVLSNFLISHFTGPDTVHVLDVEVRGASQLTHRYTLANVPGPQRPDVPLYVLTSRGTVSAGEDFAFVMKNIGRATLVGETTAGAGRNNPTFDVGHGFGLSLSVSRVMDPKTKAEWEGIGVKPDVAVPPRNALAAAHALALRNLADSASGPMQRNLELTREFVNAQARSDTLDPSALQRFTGVYGGERTVTVEHGRLTFRRTPDRLGQELVPISDSTFALGPTVRVTFERDGAAYRMRLVPPVGETLVFARTGNAPRIPSEY